jgi:hypothetical protein
MTEIEMLEAQREKHEEAIKRIDMRIQELKYAQMVNVYPFERDCLIDPAEQERKHQERERQKVIDNLAFFLSGDSYNWSI